MSEFWIWKANYLFFFLLKTLHNQKNIMKPQYTFCCYATILLHTHSFTEKREWSMWWGAKMQVWVGLCPIDCTLAYYYKHIRWLKHMWMAYGSPFECNFVFLFGKSVFVYIAFKYRFDFFFIIPIQAKMNDGGFRQWEFKFGFLLMKIMGWQDGPYDSTLHCATTVEVNMTFHDQRLMDTEMRAMFIAQNILGIPLSFVCFVLYVCFIAV